MVELKRAQLEKLVGKRVTFTGKLQCYGSRYHMYYFNGKAAPKINRNITVVTMCFVDVYIDGIYIDHIWVTDSRRLRHHNLQSGSIVSFTGNIKPYVKGEGYGIEDKREVKVLKKGNGRSLIDYLTYHSENKNFGHQYDKYIPNKVLQEMK